MSLELNHRQWPQRGGKHVDIPFNLEKVNFWEHAAKYSWRHPDSEFLEILQDVGIARDFNMRLIEFMQSDLYVNYLDDLDEKMSVKIDRVSTLHGIVEKIELDSLNYASLTLEDLKWLIENYRIKTINYILIKLEKYTEPDGGNDNIVNLAPKINFPIGHLIEFYILLKKPEELIGYIKKIRIPDAKKYGKEITSIFNEV